MVVVILMSLQEEELYSDWENFVQSLDLDTLLQFL